MSQKMILECKQWYHCWFGPLLLVKNKPLNIDMQLAVCVCDDVLTLYHERHLWSSLSQHFLNCPLQTSLKYSQREHLCSFSIRTHEGLKINMFILVLEVRKRKEYHQHRWSGGGDSCWHVQLFHLMDRAFNGGRHCVCNQTRSRADRRCVL